MPRSCLLCVFLFSLLLCVAGGFSEPRSFTWCGGDKSVRESPSTWLVWIGGNSHVSVIDYKLCSSRRHDVTSLATLRFRSTALNADRSYNLCDRRLDCLQAAADATDDGYCIEGRIQLDFPFDASAAADISVADIRKQATASYCVAVVP